MRSAAGLITAGLLLLGGCGSADPPAKPPDQRITLIAGSQVLRRWQSVGQVYYYPNRTPWISFTDKATGQRVLVKHKNAILIIEDLPRLSQPR
jgi:hypothetical protein